MVTRRPFLSLAAIFLSIGSLWADARQTYDQPTRKWSRGPVRWLLTPEEEKQFKALKTDSEVANFIRDFWARRDPTPGTPENEFADQFWKRVDEADRLFPQTTESGAASDRGEVYMALGRPTKMPPPGKNVEWVYENLPNVQPSTFTIQFHSADAGILLLLGKKQFEQIVTDNEFLRGLGPKAKEIYAPKPVVAEALPPVADAPPPEAPPTEERKILDAAGTSDALPNAIPTQVRTDMYEAIGGDVYVVITLGIPRTPDVGAGLVGFARITPQSGTGNPVTLAEADSFGPADPENSDSASALLLFQGGASLHPGSYALLAGVRDPASGKVGMIRQPFEAPAYGDPGLKISTVLLARSLKGPQAPSADAKRTPFTLGSFRVVPALNSVFKQGSDLAWYYQIYNASPDPSTGKPNLTIQYDFLLKQKGEYRPVTAPRVSRNRTNQVEAFSFQLVKPSGSQAGWVDGEYKLVIKITDEVAKTSVSHEIPFTVVP